MNIVCGLDVHKDSIFACVMKENGEKTIREFGTLTPDLNLLRNWLVEESASSVAMESTSIWRIADSPILAMAIDNNKLCLAGYATLMRSYLEWHLN